MCPFHRVRIGGIERAFMLIDENAICFQCLVAVPVKLLGKQPFANAERVSRINDNQIIFVFDFPDKPQTILNVHVNSRVIKSAGSKRQIFLRQFDYHLINFRNVNMFDGRIAYQFPNRSAVPCSNDQNVPNVRVGCHRNMGNHFMIDVLIFLCQHQQTI